MAAKSELLTHSTA